MKNKSFKTEEMIEQLSPTLVGTWKTGGMMETILRSTGKIYENSG